MQKLKLALKIISSKSKVKNLLVKIVYDTKHDLSREKHVNPLVQRFQESETSEDGGSLYELFNEYLKHCNQWIPALKLLYVAHELIDNVGSNFCRTFLSEYFDNISNLMNRKGDVEDHVHAVLAANYYNFLIIYAKYFPDIKTHLSKDPKELSKSLQKGEFKSLVQLVSFKNVVKYFTKVEECIEGSASVLKEKGLISKISLLLFRDVVMIYNLISKMLEHAIPQIFTLENNLALLLDELYSDIIQITNKMKQLVTKSTLVDQSQIPSIKYFTFDPEFNKEEELYMLEIKKTKQKSHEKPDPCRQYLESYQTIAPGKKLYKLNTGVTHLMRIPENPSNQQKEYFMLGSPEPSQIEDDSVTPFYSAKKGENENYLASQGGMVLGETDVQSYKDINPVQLEIQFQKNTIEAMQEPYHFQNQYKQHMKKELKLNSENISVGGKAAESLIFTPTSHLNSHYFNEDGWTENPIENFKKEVTKKSSLDNLKDDNWDKRRMNINLANL